MQNQAFRESQGLAGQAGVEQSRGQVITFDISRALAKQFNQLRFFAPNGFQGYI